jgi:hypothetical protein
MLLTSSCRFAPLATVLSHFLHEGSRDKMTGAKGPIPNVRCGGWIGNDTSLLVFLMISRLGLRCRIKDIQAEKCELRRNQTVEIVG